jgi:hypothetical protein
MSLFAYLDAGSGSLILQAILGGLAGIAVAFKAWKARMVGRKAVENAEANAEDTTVSTES